MSTKAGEGGRTLDIHVGNSPGNDGYLHTQKELKNDDAAQSSTNAAWKPANSATISASSDAESTGSFDDNLSPRLGHDERNNTFRGSSSSPSGIQPNNAATELEELAFLWTGLSAGFRTAILGLVRHAIRGEDQKQ